MLYVTIGDYLLVATLVALVTCIIAQVDETPIWAVGSGALLLAALLDRQAAVLALIGIGGCLLLKVLVQETFGKRSRRSALTLDLLMTEDEDEAARAFFS